MVEAWVSFDRFSPWKFASALRPPLGRRLARAVLRLEALHRSPGFDQGTIDREVLGREQLLHPGLGQYGGQELGRDVAFEQPIAVLREGRVIPGCVIDAESDEPAKQQIVFEPLHQLALGADRVEGLQQHRPQQLLRRDRGSTHASGVQDCELALQHCERRVDDLADRPQWMIRAHPGLQIDIGE